MGTLRVLPLLAILLIGCNQDHDITNSNNDGECACNSMAREDSTYNSGRGALLGSRFSSFEALKSVIQIEYGGSIASDSTATANCYVRLRHCCNGRSVVNILAAGTSQGDILKARDGSIWDGVILLFHCPYAIMIRKDLGNIYNLSSVALNNYLDK